MIVTTARKQADLEEKAQRVAHDLNILYVKRKSFSLQKLCAIHQAERLILLTEDKIKCVFCHDTNHSFYFHPNIAMVRLRRLRKGQIDLFIETSQLQVGQSLLDCTMGLASDATVASYVVGKEGKVMALESDPVIAYIVQNGLQRWKTNHDEFDQALRRVQVCQKDHLEYLRQCDTNAYDVVYFDPMFEQTVNHSFGISALKKLTSSQDLHDEVIEEAKRVARLRVVMKDSQGSSRFATFGFHAHVRSYATHWFGTIELESI